MPAQVETFKWCAQNEHAEMHIEGSTGKDYVVTFDRGEWHCPCKGFKYSKDQNCRHVIAAKHVKCTHGFDAVSGSPSNDWTEDGKCPECGGPTTGIRVAV